MMKEMGWKMINRFFRMMLVCVILMYWMQLISMGASPEPLTFKYDNFANPAHVSLLHRNPSINQPDGYVYVDPPSSNMILTRPQQHQHGSFFNEKQFKLTKDAGFSTYFVFKITDNSNTPYPDYFGSLQPNNGADGLVFVLQTQANNVGNIGSGIGYSHIKNSVGIEFDTFDNATDFPFDLAGDMGDVLGKDGNHIAINYNGDNKYPLARSSNSRTSKPNFKSGSNVHVWIDYNPHPNPGDHKINIYTANSATRPIAAALTADITLSNFLSLEDAYVGFTSATGGSFSKHQLVKWYFNNCYLPINLSNPYVEAPTRLTLSASPTTTSTHTTVNAQVKKTNGSPAAGERVHFESTLGSFAAQDVTTDTAGIATTTLYTDNLAGVATVTASLATGAMDHTLVIMTRGIFTPQMVKTTVNAGTIQVKDWCRNTHNVPLVPSKYKINITPKTPVDADYFSDGLLPIADYDAGTLRFKLTATIPVAANLHADLIDLTTMNTIENADFKIITVEEIVPPSLSDADFDNAVDTILNNMTPAPNKDAIIPLISQYIKLLPKSPSDAKLLDSLDKILTKLNALNASYAMDSDIILAIDSAAAKICELNSVMKVPTYYSYGKTGAVIANSELADFVSQIASKSQILPGLNQILQNKKFPLTMRSQARFVSTPYWTSTDSYMELPSEALKKVFENKLETAFIESNKASICLRNESLYNKGNTLLFEASDISAKPFTNPNLPDGGAKIERFDIHLKRDGIDVSAWDNTVAIHLPLQYDDSQTKDTLTVYRINPDNTLNNLGGVYNTDFERMVFLTNHFSVYMIYNVNQKFNDIGSFGWAKNYIASLTAKGVISGTSTTSYSPSGFVYRSNFAIMLVNLFKLLDMTATVFFSDVHPSYKLDPHPPDGFYHHVASAVKYNIMSGYSSSTFGSSDRMKKEDIATSVSLTLKKLLQWEPPANYDQFLIGYTDAPQISSYARPHMGGLVGLNIITGQSNQLEPQLPLANRAQLAAILFKAMMYQSAQGLPYPMIQGEADIS